MTTRNPQDRSMIRAILTDLRGKHTTMKRDHDFRSRFDQLLECDETGNPLPKPVEFTSTGETRGLAVISGAGGGKTSLVQRALGNHPALPPTPTAMPVVSVSVPNPATAKSVGREILSATGYSEIAKNIPAWDIWKMVRARFRMLGTVVLWIDEAHDLFPRSSKSEAPQILKTLKSLMQGEGAVIVVLSGVESLWSGISFDHQVERRYAKVELPPVAGADDAGILWRILGKFCDRAGLEIPEQGDVADRLIHASRNRFGLCIEFMISAIERALTRGDARLDVQHFADAFFRQEGCPVGSNVFLTPHWSKIDLHAGGTFSAA